MAAGGRRTGLYLFNETITKRWRCWSARFSASQFIYLTFGASLPLIYFIFFRNSSFSQAALKTGLNTREENKLIAKKPSELNHVTHLRQETGSEHQRAPHSSETETQRLSSDWFWLFNLPYCVSSSLLLTLLICPWTSSSSSFFFFLLLLLLLPPSSSSSSSFFFCVFPHSCVITASSLMWFSHLTFRKWNGTEGLIINTFPRSQLIFFLFFFSLGITFNLQNKWPFLQQLL